jgi:hypothetical protein
MPVTKKPPSGGFLVTERNEISNLKLVEDIFKILEFAESEVSGI